MSMIPLTRSSPMNWWCLVVVVFQLPMKTGTCMVNSFCYFKLTLYAAALSLLAACLPLLIYHISSFVALPSKSFQQHFL